MSWLNGQSLGGRLGYDRAGLQAHLRSVVFESANCDCPQQLTKPHA